MNGFSRFFVRLRWKLMLAYAGTTAAAVLVTSFVAVSFQSWDMLHRSDFPGYQLQEDLQDLRRVLREDTPGEARSREQVEDRLAGFIEKDLGRDPNANDVMTLSLEPWNVELLAVIDMKGRVMATWPRGSLPSGSSLRQQLSADGDVVINDTLFGNQGVAGQGIRDRVTGDLFVGMPLPEDAIHAGGGIIVRYRPGYRDLLRVGLAPIRYALVPIFVFSTVVGVLFGLTAAWWITRRLERIDRTARAWARADFSCSIRDDSRDELGTLARTLNGMAEELRNLMATRTELAAVEERNRVARDLHDSVKQQVFAAALQVGAARELLASEPDRARESLDRAGTMIRDAGRGLTVLIRELRPAELEDKGLLAALTAHANRWSEETGIRASVRARGERATPLRLEQELFRVAQEALNNVARHSGATRVEVLLEWGPRVVELSVTDNGKGLPAEGAGTGSGIRNMRERVASVGGELHLEAAGGGARVRARVPVAPGAAAARSLEERSMGGDEPRGED